MKKKKLTYFLLAVVIVIWGLIFTQLLDSLAAKEEEALSVIPVKKTAKSRSAIPDTFQLLANYRDPFLGGRPSHGTPSVPPIVQPKQTLTTLAPPLPPRPPVDWSVITYLGLINNTKNNKRIALINLKGKEYMVGEGESIEDLKIIKNLKDSLLVSYQAENKYLKPLKIPF